VFNTLLSVKILKMKERKKLQKREQRSHGEIESRKETLSEVRLMKKPDRVLCTVRYMENGFQFAVLGFNCLLNIILHCI
jgi:hypothetical protein